MSAVERQLSIGGRPGYASGIYGLFLAWMMVALFLYRRDGLQRRLAQSFNR